LSSKYIVAMCGDLNRGERMNCGVLSWDHTLGDEDLGEAPVTVHLTLDWERIRTAFFNQIPVSAFEGLRDDIVRRLSSIKTLKDLRTAYEKMGPYTPFEFTEERASTETPEATGVSMADWFLQQEKGQKTDEGSSNG